MENGKCLFWPLAPAFSLLLFFGLRLRGSAERQAALAQEVFDRFGRLCALLQPLLATLDVNLELFFLVRLDRIVRAEVLEVNALALHARVGGNDTEIGAIAPAQLLQSEFDHCSS